MEQKYEIKIDKQGRVLISRMLRCAADIPRDSKVRIKQVRAGKQIGLLITKGEKK
jgi:hypothetical protein